MAGAGVSVGGAGMLRARRRDVSVKPNRKLDRKSSRGMIYENEELRLRTININAEVEQGQNDIKKLRRENEQLRHEIWSLRDEYDKLEEFLKSEKNREDSEDYEDRSETEHKNDDEEAEECSDYSDEETEEDRDEEKKVLSANYETKVVNETNQEEHLENAENQKISTEKMNSSNHRLHVEFDDLSVVDEEEELKKDKDRKDPPLPTGEIEGTNVSREKDTLRANSRNGYSCFSPRYGSPEASVSANSYYPERSYVCQNSDGTEFRGILPNEPSSMLLTQCPGLYDDTFSPNASYAPSGIPNVSTGYDENLRRDQMIYGSQVGWQSNIFSPVIGFQTSSPSYGANAMAAQLSSVCAPMFNSPGQSNHSVRSLSTARAGSLPRGTTNDDLIDYSGRITDRVTDNAIFSSLSQRRNLFPRQNNNFYGETIIPNCEGSSDIEASTCTDVLTRNGWDFDNARVFHDTNDRKNARQDYSEHSEDREITMESEVQRSLEDSNFTTVDRRKHFFAPLPAKFQHSRQDSSDKTSTRTMNLLDPTSVGFFECFGTGKSSSSDRTNSTVISTRDFQPRTQSLLPTTVGFFTDNGEKGSADICVNGGIPARANVPHTDHRNNNENRGYKSSDNLLIGEKDNSRDNSCSSRQGSNNPLVKSVSCQDLNSEQLQNSLFEMTRTFHGENKCQKFAKSDNTLDNPIVGSSKPFKSQLNVTLKFPGNKNTSGAGGSNSSSNSKEHGRYSPETPEIPKLPSIDYRLFNNPFLKTFDARGGIYGNYDIRSQATRPIEIRVNENSPEREKMHLQQHRPSIDYSSAVLTQSFARRLNPDESTIKSTRTYGTSSEIENDRHLVSSNTCQLPNNDPRNIGNPGNQRQDFQVTSFEAPNPRSLHSGLTAYDRDSRRIITAPSTLNPLISNHPNLYQNVPFVPGTPGIFCPGNQNAVRIFYDNHTQKVPAQTQTSIDDASIRENEITEVIVKNSKIIDTENHSAPGSPTSARRKRTVRKERVDQKMEKRPLSPAAQRRRLRKQSITEIVDTAVEQDKIVNKTRQISSSMTNTTTTTGSEHTDEKNESRSSSSGQESPRKEHNRRVSMYFNTKKRPSVGSVKTMRSFSVGDTRDNLGAKTGGGGEIVETTNSEKDKINSASGRERASGKERKSSVSSGKVPWCACWGNGCV